jgi:hypothetical protein
LNTLARCFRPASPVSKTLFHVKLASVYQFYVATLFSHPFQKGLK